ncbi:hypothetical protein EON62_00520 [archaeon]|nr:MAG: hypothetical protein EON62_00520 [archaeon]
MLRQSTTRSTARTLTCRPAYRHPPCAVLRVGVNSQAAGSSFVECGGTKVMASVYVRPIAPARAATLLCTHLLNTHRVSRVAGVQVWPAG